MKTFQTKTTKTLATVISVPEQYQVVVSIPLTKPIKGHRNTVPIEIHLSKSATANNGLGAYVYSIIDTNDPKLPVYQTLLNNAAEEPVDLAKKLGVLISKKYTVPSYVSISGDITLQDFLGVSKAVFELIETN